MRRIPFLFFGNHGGTHRRGRGQALWCVPAVAARPKSNCARGLLCLTRTGAAVVFLEACINGSGQSLARPFSYVFRQLPRHLIPTPISRGKYSQNQACLLNDMRENDGFNSSCPSGGSSQINGLQSAPHGYECYLSKHRHGFHKIQLQTFRANLRRESSAYLVTQCL